jgi:hypothetical protein
MQAEQLLQAQRKKTLPFNFPLYLFAYMKNQGLHQYELGFTPNH